MSLIERSLAVSKQWVEQGRGGVTPRNPVTALALAQRPPLLPAFVHRKPKVLSLEYGVGAVGYYRIGVPLHSLAKHGLCDVLLRRHVVEAMPSRLRDLVKQGLGTGSIPADLVKALHEAVEWADIVLVARPYTYEQLRFMMSVTQRGTRVCVDTDDHLEAIEDLGNNAMLQFWSKERREVFTQGLHIADHITVAAKDLQANYDTRWPGKVTYLPNPVDVASNRWNIPHIKYPEHSRLVLALAAGHTHNRDLALLEKPLKHILVQFPEVRLKIVGLVPDFAPQLPQRQISYVPTCDFDDFPATLADVDIVLCPLVDHSFNKAKTDTKIFEAVMAGAIAVVSPVGEYMRWQNTGITYAGSEEEWIEQLSQLIRTPEQIPELYKKSIRFLLAYRSIDRLVGLWYSTYSTLVSVESKSREPLPYGAQSVHAGGS